MVILLVGLRAGTASVSISRDREHYGSVSGYNNYQSIASWSRIGDILT
jgi:hypothetical protein